MRNCNLAKMLINIDKNISSHLLKAVYRKKNAISAKPSYWLLPYFSRHLFYDFMRLYKRDYTDYYLCK